jgi:phage-related tail fiber protein
MADIRRNLGLPSGVVFPFAGTAAPYGYIICDGSAVLRTDYPALFAAIGTTHGAGNGTTTFNLPDYRGRFLRGVDGLAGLDPDKAGRTAMNSGGATGNNVGSVQDAAIPNIAGQWSTGSVAAPSGAFAYTNQGNGNEGSNDGFWDRGPVTFDASRSSSVYQSTTEARPKNANVNYIIKI